MTVRRPCPLPAAPRTRHLLVVPLVLALGVFLTLGAYQLSLPGLHYDEAREAGLNAVELIVGQPVTAFRDAAIQVGPWQLPLMVQDYIGALNVYLALPFLVVGGVNVLNHPLDGTRLWVCSLVGKGPQRFGRWSVERYRGF